MHRSRSPARIVVGLAGAVAGGKSTVAQLFGQLGAEVVDADAVAREEIGRPAVRRAVARAFGRDVLIDGQVDRAKLASRAFRSAATARRLNAIVHPHVVRRLRGMIGRARGVFILEAPLLHESGADAWCDAVVYVDTPRVQRLSRARSRGWPRGEVARRERLQWSATRKKESSDYIIDNSGPLAETRRQIKALYQRFVQSLQA